MLLGVAVSTSFCSEKLRFFLIFEFKITEKHLNQKKVENSQKGSQPAFGCAQHPEAGWNTQQLIKFKYCVLQDKELSMEIHFWLVVIDNALLAFSYYVLYFLYKFDIYNPWCNLNMSALLFPEEWLKCSISWMSLIIMAATLPTVIVGSSRLSKYLTLWTWWVNKTIQQIALAFWKLGFDIKQYLFNMTQIHPINKT